MRWLGRLLMLLALGAALALAGRWFAAWRWDASLSVPSLSAEQLAQSRRGIAYQLATGDWLAFRLLPAGGQLKVLINATVPLAALARPPALPAQWVYEVWYRVRGADGRQLAAGQIPLRSEVAFGLTASGEPLRQLHGPDPTLAFTEGRLHLLADPGSAAQWLDLRLQPLEAPVRGAVARVYQRERVAEHKLAYLWPRLNLEARERLGEASVHGADLLRDSERLALLRQRWKPLTPQGVAGRDYLSQVLYQLGPEAAAPIEPPAPPPGLLVGPLHDGIIEIPGGGELYATLTQVPQAVTGAPGTVTRDPQARAPAATLQWLGRPATRHAAWLAPLDAPVRARLDPGLLVVRAPVPVAVRAWWRPEVAGDVAVTQDAQARSLGMQPGGAPDAGVAQDAAVPRLVSATAAAPPSEPGRGVWREITPEPLYLRTWVLQPGASLQLAVTHADTQGTPWRIDLRGLWRAATELQPGGDAWLGVPVGLPGSLNLDVDYAWLDAAGQLLDQGRIARQAPLSRLDQAVADPGVLVSEAQSLYFRLPPQVAALRLSAAQPLLVAVYSRPAGLPRRQVLPPLPREERLPDWLGLRPADWRERQQRGDSLLLTLQPDLPRIDPAIMAGHYQAESFLPAGRWRGRHLLLPAEPGPLRDQALASRYLELRSGESRLLTFAAAAGPVTPQLICLRGTSAPGEALLSLDGAPWLRPSLRLDHTRFALSAIAPGRRQVRLEGPPGLRCFISHTHDAFSDVSRSWLSRFAVRLDRAPLEVPYRKDHAGEEGISLRWLAPLDADGSQRLRVRIEGAAAARTGEWGPADDWSALDHLLELGPAPAAGVVVLQAPEERLDGGTLASVPFGADLPVGDYRLRIQLERGEGGYLILSRLLPGDFPWSQVRQAPD